MAKFCGNCGTQLDDNVKVCGQCGTPVETLSAIPSVKIDDPEKQKKAKKMFKLICSLVAIIAVAIVAINIVFNFTGCKGLLRKVMNAYENYDIDKLVSLSSDMYYYGEEDWVEYYFEYSLGEDLDYFEAYVGHDYKLRYDVQDIYTLPERKLSSILDTVEASFPDYDVSSISQVKIADIEVTAKKGTSSTSIAVQVTMVKEHGSWKLLYID